MAAPWKNPTKTTTDKHNPDKGPPDDMTKAKLRVRGARAFQQRAHIQLRGETLAPLACMQQPKHSMVHAAGTHAANARPAASFCLV